MKVVVTPDLTIYNILLTILTIDIIVYISTKMLMERTVIDGWVIEKEIKRDTNFNIYLGRNCLFLY